MTKGFRRLHARKHFSKAREASEAYRAAVDTWGEAVAASEVQWTAVQGFRIPTVEWSTALAWRAVSSRKWHRDRAKGQRFRFSNLRACGTRFRWSSCRACKLDSRDGPTPEGCGIARLCSRCALAEAKQKRARFGRARATTILGSPEKIRRRYREMMLTLTVPHAKVAELHAWHAELAASLEDPDAHDGNSARRVRSALREGRELLAFAEGDTVRARVEVLWRAWPRFTRKVIQHWRDNRETVGGGEKGPLLPRFHRAAEWTPGDDGLGHPHFHVWLWAPHLPFELLRQWWGEALAECGWTKAPTRDELPVVHVKEIHAFNFAMGAELLKGGKRDALTLSKLTIRARGPGGEDFFEYSEGWTIHEVLDTATPDVIASLYCALEAKRLSQGSSGFFGQDPPAACPHCLAVGAWQHRFEKADAKRPPPPRELGEHQEHEHPPP